MAELAAGGLREALDNPHFVGAMRHAPKTDTAGTRVKPFHGHTEADTEAARKADEAWRRTEAR